MILVTECASGDIRTPSRSPPSSEKQLSCAASALVETPLLHGRPFTPALSYAPQREPLLYTHIPSPPPKEGGINLMLRLGAQRARSGELHAGGSGSPGSRSPGHRSALPSTHARGLGRWAVRSPEGEAAPQPRQARRKAGAPRSRGDGVGNSGRNRSQCSWPDVAAGRLVPGKAPHICRPRCWWAIGIIRNYKPGGYSRHSRCSPPGKEKRSWAPGHGETGGGGSFSLAAGYPKGVWGQLWARGWEGAARRTCGPHTLGSPGAHSAGPCRRRAAAGRPGGALGPRRSPAQRAQGDRTPRRGAGRSAGLWRRA